MLADLGLTFENLELDSSGPSFSISGFQAPSKVCISYRYALCNYRLMSKCRQAACSSVFYSTSKHACPFSIYPKAVLDGVC